MIDDQNPSNNSDSPNADLKKIGATPETANTAEADNKQQQTNQYRSRARHVMGPLKADWESHAQSELTGLTIKALLSRPLQPLLSAILTGFYVRYSRAQWHTMRDQYMEMQTAREQANRDNAAAHRLHNKLSRERPLEISRELSEFARSQQPATSARSTRMGS